MWNVPVGSPRQTLVCSPGSLTETVESLQAHMEALQEQVEQLTTEQSERARREQAQQQQRRTSLSALSVPCLKELYDMHQDKYICTLNTQPHTAQNTYRPLQR